MTRRTAWSWLFFGVLLAGLAGWFSLAHEARKRSVFDGEIPATDPRVISFNLVKHELPNQEWVGLIVRTQSSVLDQKILATVQTITAQFSKTPFIIPDSLRSLTNVRVIVPGEELATELLVPSVDLTTAGGSGRIQARLMANQLLKRELVSRDERASLVSGYVAPGFTQAAVAHYLNQLAVAYGTADIEILPIGNIVANQAMDEGIEAQSTIFAAISLVILFFLFIWLRMAAAGALMVALMIASLIELKAFQVLLNLPDSVVLSATPLLLIALGVSYFYYLVREAAQYGIREARRALTVPTWFSVLATAYGFGTLLTFQILSIREFGLVTALGISLVMLNVWWVYPAVFSLWPKLLPAPDYGAKAVLVGLTSRLLAFGRHWLALILIAVLLIAGQLGRDRLHTNTDPFRFFPGDHPVVRALHGLEQFGGNSELVIAIRPRPVFGELPWTPALLEQLFQLEQRLATLPKVGDVAGYASLADEVANKFYPPAVRVQERFPAQISGLMEQLVSSAELERVISLDRQTVFIRVWATAWTTDEVKMLLGQIRQEFQPLWTAGYRDIARSGLGRPEEATIAFGGFDTLWIAIGDYVVAGKLSNFFWGIVLMPLVALPFIGSGGLGWRGRIFRSLIVTMPLAAALHETLGVMGWLGIQLDLASCVITSIGIGVGEDFAIHLLHYYDRRGSFEGAAVENAELLTYALLTAVGFASFAFSGFLPLRQFAGLVLVILSLSYLNAMLLVPLGVRAANKVLGVKNFA